MLVHDRFLVHRDDGFRSRWAVELLKVKWADLDLEERTLQLYDTKNGEDRKVPLTVAAARVLEEWSSTSERIFPVTSVAVRQAWDRLVKRAGITNHLKPNLPLPKTMQKTPLKRT